MAVVTISRETGTEGDIVGQGVAEAMGVPYAGREVIEQAARAAGLPQEVLEAKEREDARGQTFATSDMVGLVRRSQSGRRQQMEDSLYLRYITEAMRQLITSPCVIAGRGSQFILADEPKALHVHLYAPEASRAAKLALERRVSIEMAARLVRDGDTEKANFVKRYFNNANWRNPDYYHLLLDTSRISSETATELIVLAARSLG